MEDIEDFFRAYAAAVEARDVAAIAAAWAYPSQVVSDLGDRLQVVAVPDAGAFSGPLSGLLEHYRRVGCKRIRLLELKAERLSGSLCRAVVRWGLLGLADLPLYDFTTSYVLGRFDGRWRAVSAVAHDEQQQYRRFIGR